MFWLTVRHYGVRWSASRRAMMLVQLGAVHYDLDTGERVEL